MSYAFFLTFFRIGSPGISPSYWLFVWLGFATILIFNPLPIWYRSSRVWFLRIFGRVISSGVHTVEVCYLYYEYPPPHCPVVLGFLARVSTHHCVIEFKLSIPSISDQLCSFTFTISNIPVFACAYSVGFNDEWNKCGSTSPLWPIQWVAASWPLLARLIQSLRRYFESGQLSHLVNVGVDIPFPVGDLIFPWTGREVRLGNNQQPFLLLVASIRYVMIAGAFLIRLAHSVDNNDSLLALWCMFNTAYAIYASAWVCLLLLPGEALSMFSERTLSWIGRCCNHNQLIAFCATNLFTLPACL